MVWRAVGAPEYLALRDWSLGIGTRDFICLIIWYFNSRFFLQYSSSPAHGQ